MISLLGKVRCFRLYDEVEREEEKEKMKESGQMTSLEIFLVRDSIASNKIFCRSDWIDILPA